MPLRDMLLPFLIDATDFRGRMVRMEKSVTEIVMAHDYPPSVQQLLAEALALTALLGAMLKFEGIFTVQTKGDGIVPTMVCDMTHEGHLRGYAAVDSEKFHNVWRIKEDRPDVRDLLGKGHIAFTVDQGQHMQRYQGLVELSGQCLSECVQHYFRQSEQITTAVKLATQRIDSGWMSSALMLQKLPEQQISEKSNVTSDDWHRAMLLLQTLKDEELLGTDDSEITTVLYRLFHEDGVRVFDPITLQAKCRCAREKIIDVLKQFTPEALEEYRHENGEITMDSQFCNKHYSFQMDEIHASK